MADTKYDKLIIKATRISKHSFPTATDFAYWRAKFAECEAADGQEGIDYAYKRCLGWQAGGIDIPPYGPYGKDPGAAPPPPYPEELDETPQDPPHDPPPSDPPAPTDDQVMLVLVGMLSKLDALLAAVNQQRVEVVAATEELRKAVKDGVRIRFN